MEASRKEAPAWRARKWRSPSRPSARCRFRSRASTARAAWTSRKAWKRASAPSRSARSPASTTSSRPSSSRTGTRAGSSVPRGQAAWLAGIAVMAAAFVAFFVVAPLGSLSYALPAGVDQALAVGLHLLVGMAGGATAAHVAAPWRYRVAAALGVSWALAVSMLSFSTPLDALVWQLVACSVGPLAGARLDRKS